MWNRKIIHRNGSGTITLNRKMMEDAGWDNAESVSVEIVNGVVTMRPVRGRVLERVAGIDCFSWEDVEYVGRMMREKGYVPGVNEPKAAAAVQGAEESHHEP
jgi:antitoxin component of MazEF toxin-antitoxin module